METFNIVIFIVFLGPGGVFMKYLEATALGRERYRLGEGPCYDPVTGMISWVDITANTLWTMHKNGVREPFVFDQPIGAAVPVKGSSGFLLAAKDGLYLYEEGKTRLILDLKETYRDFWRSNDAKADPAGRLWFGASVGDDEHEADGNLYRLSEGQLKIMQAGTKISNGMAWSSDRTRFYFSDTLKYAVFVYDYDLKTGEIRNGRPLCTYEDGNGFSDGLCIDCDDNLWIAIWGGNRVEKRSGKTGEKLAEIHVPSRNVTSCCFMGDKMDTLLITTSGDGLEGAGEGCLYTCKTDAVGPAPDKAVL